MSIAKWRPLWVGLNGLTLIVCIYAHDLLNFGIYIFGMIYICWPVDKFKVSRFHDDDIKWKHFPRYWPFVWGIHRSPVNSPHKGHWRGALVFSLICLWINGWVNNHEAGDLRRYRAHYDAIVMLLHIVYVRFRFGCITSSCQRDVIDLFIVFFSLGSNPEAYFQSDRYQTQQQAKHREKICLIRGLNCRESVVPDW